MKRVVHLEASLGWGGQEIRSLREAEGMRVRGHGVYFITAPGAQLAERARAAGFSVEELPMRKSNWLSSLPRLCRWLRQHKISCINTHSSLDGWLGGMAGRLCGIPVIRTRHLSTPNKPGLNSRIIYRWLANQVVTTCEDTAARIRLEVGLDTSHCRSIPTGVNSERSLAPASERDAFREAHGIAEDDVLCGTVCVLRSWKGVDELLEAAALLRDTPKLRWLIVGGGPQEERLRKKRVELGLEKQVIMLGQVEDPHVPLSAMDVFLLLSTANEGVSQSCLQAAQLAKPLITTRTGGLHEVCLDGQTGRNVENHSAEQVAKAVQELLEDADKRRSWGDAAAQLVADRFTMQHTLDQMEAVYAAL